MSKKICHQIVDRFNGIDSDNYSRLEKQIAQILIDEGFAYMENNFLRKIDPKKPNRVSFFSAHEKPQHFENLSDVEKQAKVYEGKNQQYKVSVTFMSDPKPETW